MKGEMNRWALRGGFDVADVWVELLRIQFIK